MPGRPRRGRSDRPHARDRLAAGRAADRELDQDTVVGRAPAVHLAGHLRNQLEQPGEARWPSQASVTGVIGATRRTRSASTMSSPPASAPASTRRSGERSRPRRLATPSRHPGSSASRRSIARGRSRRRPIAAEPEARVGAHHDGVELEGEATGSAEPAIRAWRSSSPSQASSAGDRVAHRAGPIVVLGRGRRPEAPAGVGALEVGEVGVGHRPQARCPLGRRRAARSPRRESGARRPRPSPAAAPAWSRSGRRGRSCSSPARRRGGRSSAPPAPRPKRGRRRDRGSRPGSRPPCRSGGAASPVASVAAAIEPGYRKARTFVQSARLRRLNPAGDHHFKEEQRWQATR